MMRSQETHVPQAMLSGVRWLAPPTGGCARTHALPQECVAPVNHATQPRGSCTIGAGWTRRGITVRRQCGSAGA
jgi:hypothetical protein